MQMEYIALYMFANNCFSLYFRIKYNVEGNVLDPHIPIDEEIKVKKRKEIKKNNYEWL